MKLRNTTESNLGVMIGNGQCVNVVGKSVLELKDDAWKKVKHLFEDLLEAGNLVIAEAPKETAAEKKARLNAEKKKIEAQLKE